MGGRRILLGTAVALVAAGLAPPTAPGAFHLISIREVYPGSSASPQAGYVELQMYSAGQQFVAGHAVTVYDAEGVALETFTFPSHLSNGANQQTLLIGDDGVQSAFGVAPDLVDADFALAAAGGAACWNGTPDCVSWGSFEGVTPSVSGTPADPGGIPDGMALRRSIAPGCATLLEAGDDSNDSAADFADATPEPRNNSSAIVEGPCVGPTTTIDSGPANPTNSTEASFAYHSNPAGASFECRLDAAVFSACSSEGVEYAGPLAEGNHTFRVRAVDSSENVGPAAVYGWRVDTTAPTTFLDAQPDDPSPGASVNFKYHASEVGSSFECSLAAGEAGDEFFPCSAAGKTYVELPDGPHTFKVRAEDAAGNQGESTVHEWTVDNSLLDTTPPDTVIDGAPPDPSTSSTASFSYHSTEPGSSFECKLDGGAFAACGAGGIEYSGLADGTHSFQVRAIDPSENVDPSPAGYTFDVVLSAPVAPVPTLDPSPPIAPPRLAPRRPNTRIVAGPRGRTRDRTPTFRFRANVRRARFRCRVDRGRFRRCRSPFTTRRLRAGRHRLLVRAFARGRADPTPARRVFRVVGGRGRRSARGRNRNRRARASAFHLVSIREVYPGSAANPGAEYVELQAYAAGQNFVRGHSVTLLDAAGGQVGSAKFGVDAPAGGNQITLLAATAAAESQFGVAADAAISGGGLDPAGGAVCWEALDCVAWGSFHGAAASPTGSPADSGGIPDGMALRRSIAPGCATLLEAGDDSNDSAADFFDAFPAPRPNSVPPPERACSAGSGAAGDGTSGGSAGGPAARRRPQTRLRRRPGRIVRRRFAVFRFVSNRRGAIFHCKLDRRRTRRCRSPFVARRLRPGRHVFRVRARLRGGPVDRTPAIWRFRVVRR